MTTKNYYLSRKVLDGVNRASFDELIVSDETSLNTASIQAMDVSGTAVFNGYTSIITTYYITTEDDFPVNASGTATLLDSGTYVIDTGTANPLIITRPITIVPGAQVLLRGSVLHVNSTVALFLIEETGPNPIPTLLRLESFTAIASSPFGGFTALDCTTTSLGSYGCLFTNTRFIAYDNIGVVQNPFGFVATNFSIDTPIISGIVIDNCLTTITIGPALFQGEILPLTYVTIQGTLTQPSVIATNVNYIPSQPNTHAFYLPNNLLCIGTFATSVYDIRTTSDAPYFDPAGQTSTSINLAVSTIRNVPDGQVLLDQYNDTTVQTNGGSAFEATSQWAVVPALSPTTTNLRCTVSPQFIVSITDRQERQINATITATVIRSGGSAVDGELSMAEDVRIYSAAVTDPATDQLIVPDTTDVAIDQLVLITNAGTTTLNTLLLYYVVATTSTSITISASSGGPPIDITVASSVDFTVFQPKLASAKTEIVSRSKQVSVPYLFVSRENRQFIPILRNISNTTPIEIVASYLLIS